MSIDACAVIHCPRAEILAKIASTPLGEDMAALLRRSADAATTGEDAPVLVSLSVLGTGKDYATLFTGVRFFDLENDALFARMLAHRIVELLPPGAHEDPRGILFYPDVVEPRGETYRDALESLDGGRGCVWVPVEAVDPSARRAWLEAKTAKGLEEVERFRAMSPEARIAQAKEAFERRFAGIREQARARLEELGVFSPKEGDHVLSGLEIHRFDGTKAVLPAISLENAMKLLAPDLRPRSFSPEDLAESNRKVLERMKLTEPTEPPAPKKPKRRAKKAKKKVGERPPKKKER
jgi:hypothetical protein